MSGNQREPVVGDAFGAVLARCWEAGAVAGAAFEVVERDDGYISVGDAARYFAGADSWSPVERWACGQVTGRVLDVGCGAGRHALPLQQAGHEVVGLDASPGAVAVATQRGVNAVVGSVDQIPPGLGLFDTVLLLGNNLGLLASPERAAVVLDSLAAVTRPGGRLLGSGLDPYRTGTEAHLAYHDWNRQRGRMPGQVRMRIRDGAITTPWFDYMFVSLAELRNILTDTPWQLRHADEEGGSYAVLLDSAVEAG
jgi:SAM-dependent methyltransferase